MSVSGTNRPPNSPKYPRASGSRRRLACGMKSLEKSPNPARILDAGTRFETGRNVNSKRLDPRDRRGHVLGRQPAREQRASPRGDGRGTVPIDRASSSPADRGIVGVQEQHHPGRPVLHYGDGPFGEPDRLDHRAAIEPCQVRTPRPSSRTAEARPRQRARGPDRRSAGSRARTRSPARPRQPQQRPQRPPPA